MLLFVKLIFFFLVSITYHCPKSKTNDNQYNSYNPKNHPWIQKNLLQVKGIESVTSKLELGTYL